MGDGKGPIRTLKVETLFQFRARRVALCVSSATHMCGGSCLTLLRRCAGPLSHRGHGVRRH